jgi:hypothetical protein
MPRVERKPLEFAALVRELEGLRQSHRWHPIETAPKDGTDILAVAVRNGEPYFKITWWRQAKDKRGFTGWGEFNDEFYPATHWMPLPNPPR